MFLIHLYSPNGDFQFFSATLWRPSLRLLWGYHAKRQGPYYEVQSSNFVLTYRPVCRPLVLFNKWMQYKGWWDTNFCVGSFSFPRSPLDASRWRYNLRRMAGENWMKMSEGRSQLRAIGEIIISKEAWREFSNRTPAKMFDIFQQNLFTTLSWCELKMWHCNNTV